MLLSIFISNTLANPDIQPLLEANLPAQGSDAPKVEITSPLRHTRTLSNNFSLKKDLYKFQIYVDGGSAVALNALEHLKAMIEQHIRTSLGVPENVGLIDSHQIVITCGLFF